LDFSIAFDIFRTSRTSFLVADDASSGLRPQTVVPAGELGLRMVALMDQKYYSAVTAGQAGPHSKIATTKLCSVSLHAAVENLIVVDEASLTGAT
jgi:hypothetical protein